MKKQCECKIKVRSREEKKALINRLSRIEGQIRGIKGMIENDSYCPDILDQAAAVGAAVDAFCRKLLESHIKSCVTEEIKKGDDSVTDELVLTIKKLMR